MVTDEDIAHIAVLLPKERVLSLVDKYSTGKGYKRVSLKGERHLLGEVDWTSPFDPPARRRCMMLIPDQNGWSTLVDQLDHLDMNLAKSLSRSAPVIGIKGYHELQEFEYCVLEAGEIVNESGVPDYVTAILEFIKSNPDHVTKFRYDELCLRLPRKLGSAPIDYLGYSLE